MSRVRRDRWREAWRAFALNKGGVGGLIVIGAVSFMALFGRWLRPVDPRDVGAAALEGPSTSHLFGTDQFGRDVLSRVIGGAEVVLAMPTVAVGIGLAVGIPLGLLAGYLGGASDTVIMRGMDIMLAFPSLLLALAVVAVLGPGLTNVELAVGISLIPIFVRAIRGSVLSEKNKVYVDGARIVGCSQWRIGRRYLWPNVATTVIVVGTSAAGWAIVIGASLNFLGLGIQPPAPDWGADLSAARSYIFTAWWMMLFPGLAITAAVLAVNLVGESLQNVLNPRTRRR